MNERRRNMAVGVFVLLGAILLAVLILMFSNLAALFKEGYFVTARMGETGGAAPGMTVRYLGIEVGEVDSVSIAPDRSAVIIRMRIDKDQPIPANAVLRSSMGTFGGAYLDIGLPREQGGIVAPAEPLPIDGSAILKAESGQSLAGRIDQLTAKFDKVGQLVDQLTELTAPRTLEEVRQKKASPNLTTAIAQFQVTVAAIGDEENLSNLKGTLRTLAETSAKLDKTVADAQVMFGKATYAIDKTTADVEEVKEKTVKLLDRLQTDSAKLADFLDTLNSLAKGVQEGKGTVGKLLTSDELHRELKMLIIQINHTFEDINRLVIKLEEQGLLRKGG